MPVFFSNNEAVTGLRAVPATDFRVAALANRLVRLNNRALRKIRSGTTPFMLQAIHDIFNNREARKLFLRLRYVLALALLVWLALNADAALFLPAFLVSLFGQAIQLWSFAALVKNEQLTARGPYVLVRNPMYLGRFFLILGLMLLLDNLYLTAAYVVLYYFYMVNRVQREERLLEELLGQPYRDYCARVNRFLPSFGRLSDPAVRFFDWGVLRRNNGHWNLLATLLFYGVLYGYVVYFR